MSFIEKNMVATAIDNSDKTTLAERIGRFQPVIFCENDDANKNFNRSAWFFQHIT
jgi:hypothetical protein